MVTIRPNPTLPEDLICEILVRVPVKSLLCFQSVSKTWLSLIKHPAFVKSQLRHAVSITTDQSLIFTSFRHYNDEKKFEKKFSLLHAASRKIVADFKFPYSLRSSNSIIIGSANGIVCVANTCFPNCKTSIYLWNPAIRQSKVISVCNIVGEVYGFGYDKIDQDFKVVRVVRSRSTTFYAKVYSDNQQAWRELPDPVDIPYSGHFELCFSRFLCIIGEHGILVFDLNKEVLNCAIKLPVISDDDDARIIEYNNCVSVVILIKGMKDIENADQISDGKINIWTLDDDACLSGGGVEASWTPIFSIDTNLGTLARIIYGYLSSSNLLLLMRIEIYDYAWISCDIDKKEAKIVPRSVDIDGLNYNGDFYQYTESLVSLAGFELVNCKATW